MGQGYHTGTHGQQNVHHAQAAQALARLSASAKFTKLNVGPSPVIYPYPCAGTASEPAMVQKKAIWMPLSPPTKLDIST